MLQEHNIDISDILREKIISSQMRSLGLGCHCTVDVEFCAIALYCPDLI